MVLYILIFQFLKRRREGEGLCIERQQAFPEFNLLLIYSLMKILFVSVLPFSSPPRPERLWGPPSLLPNGYQGLFPWR
jgi:hypothetical protein